MMFVLVATDLSICTKACKHACANLPSVLHTQFAHSRVCTIITYACTNSVFMYMDTLIYTCHRRHEMPTDKSDPLAHQNMKDRFYGKDDPVAKKVRRSDDLTHLYLLARNVLEATQRCLARMLL